jgi:cytidylate kinase
MVFNDKEGDTMAIITISHGSYSMGKQVAQKVAQKLGYDIISRDFLFNASDRFHIPQKELEKAIHDAPGVFEQYSHTKAVYLAYIRSTLTELVVGGNIVYHGLAGHLLLNSLPQVLKIRITAGLESRVKRRVKEGGSQQQARAHIMEDDDQRKKWTRKIYHADPNDGSLYDLVIRIDKLSKEDAVGFICKAASSKVFESSRDHIRQARDLSLACKLKAALVEGFPTVGVICEYGNLLVYAGEKQAHLARFTKIMDQFQRKNVGIHNIEVHTGLAVPANAV